MRELTESMASFTWAMGVFGARQMTRVLLPSDTKNPFADATKSFDAVTGTTVAQLPDLFHRTFRAGDEMQRGMQEVAFAMLSFDPNRVLRSSSSALQRSADAFRQVGTGGSGGSGANNSGQPCGWPPMPAFE